MWRFSEDRAFVERRCLLFEAGSYPDKGVTVTSEMLEEIAANSPGAIPVKIEHLPESPIDGALGIVHQLHVVGEMLWGVLRQPIETWRVMEISGARALSVGLDIANRRLLEASFVCHPRVKRAQVFSESGKSGVGCLALGIGGETGDLGMMECGSDEIQHSTPNMQRPLCKGGKMRNVKQFATELMGYLRGILDGGEGDSEGEGGHEMALKPRVEAFSVPPAPPLIAPVAFNALSEADRRIRDWKREGRIRATPETERLAKALLTFGGDQSINFDEGSVSLPQAFIRFVESNGEVVPMGERIPAELPGKAGEKLIALTRERVLTDRIGYVEAFTAVTAANPELAMAARE